MMAEQASDPPTTRELARAIRSADLDRAGEILERLDTLYAIPPGPGAATAEEGRPTSAGALTEEGAFVPFYFTRPDLARSYGLEHDFFDETDEGAVSAVEVTLALRRCLERGFAGLILDAGSDDPAPLARETLAALARTIDIGWDGDEAEGDANAAGRSASAESSGTLTPPPHVLDLADRVRRSPPLETVPPPDIEPAECGRLLQELRQLRTADRIPVWELLDILAYEMAFHVPVRPEPVQGLRWPLVARHPQDPETPAVWIFTNPDHGRRAMEGLPEDIELLHLSGLEAFRWIWAAPSPIEEIIVDLYPETPGPFSIPDIHALGALYPHILEDVRLQAVERVPLSDIGGLPGARGTKPECVRALVEQWSDLVTVENEGGDPMDPVRHEGRRFLPVFSSTERYRDFAREHRDRAGTAVPVREGDGAPFREWLRQTSDLEGVILDPKGPHPLPLEHTDLLVLALWSENGHRPEGADLAGAIAASHGDLGPRVTGRIVADWPRYFWALQSGEEEEQPRAMTLPGRDACPVFTTEQRILTFLEQARERDLVDPGMRPLMYLTGWAFNVFQEMRARYREGGWIDPPIEDVVRVSETRDVAGQDPGDSLGNRSEVGGLELEPEAVRAALARIEWRLQPRIPGFLAEE